MEVVLNLFPLTAQEQAEFQAAAPQAEHVFFPADAIRNFLDVPQQLLERATIILGNPRPDSLFHCANLKWLQTWTAGMDAYLAAGLLPESVMLTSCVGAYGQAVSEHMLACMLALMKRLPSYRDNQAARIWQDTGLAQTPVGATVLILGTGDIGSHFAALAKALGARTVGFNRHPERRLEHFDQLCSIEQLDLWLPRADVVALALPGSEETRHIIDGRRLACMGQDAILLNAGRGYCVDCLALAEALQQGRLRGAALDVTDPEPLPADHPLWGCANLLLTPHAAGGGHLEQSVQNIYAIARDNLTRFLTGQPLRNRVR